MKYIFLFLFLIIFFIILYLLYEYIKYTVVNKKINFYKNFDTIFNEKYKDNGIYLNKLPNYIQNFYKEIENYLNIDIYFYGSILRDDYHYKYSDIDTCFFIKEHHDFSYVIDKLLDYFNRNKIKDNKAVIKIFESSLELNNYTYKGILINYKSNKLRTDFSIYYEKYKTKILMNNIQKTYTIHPLQSRILKHLKYLTNELNLLKIEHYNYIKNEILSIGYENIYNSFNKDKIKQIEL
jgi:hypothetical protein